MIKEFPVANSALQYWYDYIISDGIIFQNTKAIFNCGFVLNYPAQNEINLKWRKWKKEYAEAEWQWYLSGNRHAGEIAKKAKIWYDCMDKDGNVNSNYGYQWNRGDQINYVVNELKRNLESRRACISIYDAKEHHLYEKDTPCTMSINFYILKNKLNMSVLMRSCDLIYGFCNDQYCFSELQKMIANKLNIDIGQYYHYSTNLHIYEKHFNIGQ